MVVNGRRLCDLAPDALGQILSYLSANATCRLWLCGEKHLQTRLLGRDGVKSFCLRDLTLSFVVWPSIIGKFSNLTVFRIDVTDMVQLALESAHLMQLSSTLRKIGLHCMPNCYWAFRDLLSQTPQKFPVLEELDIRQLKNRHEEGTRKLVGWPSSLRTLKLNIPDDLDLRELPTSLEYLSFEGGSLLNMDTAFPVTMKELHVVIGDHTLRLPIESLPQDLETLYLSRAGDPYSDIVSHYGWNLENLPKGLTSLSIPTLHTKATLNALPRSLTFLDNPLMQDFSNDAEHLVEFWPPSLTSAGDNTPLTVTKDIAKKLPRSLRWLGTHVFSDALPYIPVGVNSLKIEGSLDQFKKEMAYLGLTTIPTPLDKLSFYGEAFEELSDTFPLDMLPHSLTFLELWVAQCSLTFWKALAQSQLQKVFQLTTLNTIANVQPEYWHLLPRTLTNLSIKCVPINNAQKEACFTTQDLKALPNALKTLRIECREPYRLCFDFDSILALPKSITNLDTAVSLANVPSAQLEIRTRLPNLRESRLRLQSGSTTALAVLFASLPTSLQGLVIESKENIPLDIETVQRLPRESDLRITILFPDIRHVHISLRKLKSRLQELSS